MRMRLSFEFSIIKSSETKKQEEYGEKEKYLIFLHIPIINIYSECSPQLSPPLIYSFENFLDLLSKYL